MVNQNQKEIVYNIVKHNQPIRTERVKIFAMQAGVSCADRYLRWLREDGFLVCEKHPKNRTKTWSLKPQVAAEPDPEPEPETIVESSGQFCMAGATVCLCLAASLLLGTPAAADLWPSGKAMTKEFEGYSATVYCCPAGARTIGYGFNIEEDFVRSLFSSGLLSGKETAHVLSIARPRRTVHARSRFRWAQTRQSVLFRPVSEGTSCRCDPDY